MEGPSSELAVVLTREIRWFKQGRIPDDVLKWFTDSDTRGEPEHRIDAYDTTAALNNVGVKLRNSELLDAKFRLARQSNVVVGTGMRGDVEDWMKVSQQAGSPDEAAGFLLIDKQILTRTYPLDTPTELSPAVPAGSDIELAIITVDGQSAWSLCVEAFGPPSQLDRAFRVSIARFLDETPIPPGMQFGPDDSCSYPEWIARDYLAHSA